MQSSKFVTTQAQHICRCGAPAQDPWGECCSQACARADAIALMIRYAEEATGSAEDCADPALITESIALSRMWGCVASVLGR
jgi:hypothetical protein